MGIISGTAFLTVEGIAQKNDLFINMNMHQQTEWYLHPWLWIGAAVVLSVLVVSALRGDIRERR